MRFIPKDIHAILDYLLGLLLIALPWLLGFAEGGAETWVLVIAGAGLIMYSLFTDYKYAVSRTIRMSTHLLLDIGSGLFLILSPWIFGFAELVYWPHVIVGILEIGAGLMTKTTPEAHDAIAPDRRTSVSASHRAHDHR